MQPSSSMYNFGWGEKLQIEKKEKIEHAGKQEKSRKTQSVSLEN